MKDFFLAAGSLELLQANDALTYYSHLSEIGFSSSTYISTQLALVHYHLKGTSREDVWICVILIVPIVCLRCPVFHCCFCCCYFLFFFCCWSLDACKCYLISFFQQSFCIFYFRFWTVCYDLWANSQSQPLQLVIHWCVFPRSICFGKERGSWDEIS